MLDNLPQDLFYHPDFVARLIEVRRDLHQHPELGFQETYTARCIARRLEALGIPCQTEIARTGVVGLIQGACPGPTVLLRADMDALPIQEAGDHDYRSIHAGKMHACGHDAHVSVLLGVAEILQGLREQLPGCVKLCFQPAEEGPGGAEPMIAAGVLASPTVDFALGLHVWASLPLGQVALLRGPFMAAVDTFECKIFARGGHGASPHRTPDPIVTAAALIHSWQAVVSRELDPLQPAVLSVCSIHGGSAPNIIPHEVTLQGTVRSFDDSVRKEIPQAMRRILEGVTRAYGCTSSFQWDPLYPATCNHPAVTEAMREVIQNLETLTPSPDPSPCMGGEDMSYFLREVPGCYLFLGAQPEEREDPWPHHSPHFDIHEGCLPQGVELLVKGTLRLLTRPLPKEHP
jgi:amidohydrolase